MAGPINNSQQPMQNTDLQREIVPPQQPATVINRTVAGSSTRTTLRNLVIIIIGGTIFVAGFILGGLLGGIGGPTENGSQVTSFEECQNSGGRIMQSEPRQCITDAGETFTEIASIPTGSPATISKIGSSCHPNCTIVDVGAVLTLYKGIENYEATFVNGFDCLTKHDVIVFGDDVRDVITSAPCLPELAGQETILKDEKVYKRNSGEDWTTNPDNDYVAKPFFDIPETLVTTPVKDEITGFRQDYFNEGLELVRTEAEFDHSYYLIRQTGSIDPCVTLSPAITSHSCTSKVWYFNEGLELIGYSEQSFESVTQIGYSNLNHTKSITAPI